jgi:hypothetical protein
MSTPPVAAPSRPGKYHIVVALNYRKIDQYLLNFLFGEKNKLTSPVTEIARTTATVLVQDKPADTPSSVTDGKQL